MKHASGNRFASAKDPSGGCASTNQEGQSNNDDLSFNVFNSRKLAYKW